jgi:hypothetical protein
VGRVTPPTVTTAVASSSPAHAAGRGSEATPSQPLLARIPRLALRYRRTVVAVWLVLLIAGGVASTRLSPLLSNGFGVPGTDSARAATILQQHFDDRGDGEYLLVFATRRPLDPPLRAQLQSAIDRAALRVPSAHAGAVQTAGPHLLYDTVVSQLDLARASTYTARLRGALRPPRAVHAYVTGQAAIQHDLDRSSAATSATVSSQSRFPRRSSSSSSCSDHPRSSRSRSCSQARRSRRPSGSSTPSRTPP